MQPALYFHPAILGDIFISNCLVAADPAWVDPQFDRSRLEESLWENAHFDVKPGRWKVLVDRVPLSEENTNVLTMVSDDEEETENIENDKDGVEMFVLIHNEYYQKYKEVMARLSFGIYVNIESGSLGFCDEQARHDPEFFQTFLETTEGIVDKRAAVVFTKSDGPQALFAFWEEDEVVAIATRISE